jgi:hypothetical protein
MSTEALKEINEENKAISDRDTFYLLNIETILLWKTFDKFSNGMARIKKIVSKLDDSSKFQIAKYLGFLIYKHKKALSNLSRDCPKKEVRDISNISKWTGLGNSLIFHFMSNTNKESVVQMVWTEAESAIDDMQMYRELLRDIAEGKNEAVKRMTPAQKLHWQMKAGKELLSTHTAPRKKPGALANIENFLIEILVVNKDDNNRRQITPYKPGHAPTLDDPAIKKRIADGEKMIQDGEFETINAEQTK